MRASCCTTATALALLLIAVAGCEAGDGTTLDEHGRSDEHPSASGLGSRYGAADFPATYRGISDGFFSALCTGCHSGPSSPKGLSLTPDDAHDYLVGVPSVERPALFLVEPGNPDASYLIIKLEGADGMAGRQMPRDRPARPQEEIDTIRLWIAEGAPRN